MIRLVKDIYSLEVVEKCLNAFSECGEFELTESDRHYCIEVENSKYSPIITLREFENYLLDMVNTKGII